MKILFNINNPEHVEDFKNMRAQDISLKYDPPYHTIRAVYPEIERNPSKRKPEKPMFDQDNPEHMKLLEELQLSELKIMFHQHSIPKKTNRVYKEREYTKTYERHTHKKSENNVEWREEYKRPDMIFSDMKPAFSDIFNKQFQ